MSVDITRFRGDTAADKITVQTSSGGVLDITGFTFVLTVNSLKHPPSSSTEMYSVNGTILDASSGQVEFAPASGDVDQKPGTYYYDIQMTDDIGRIKTINSGKYIYTQDITK